MQKNIKTKYYASFTEFRHPIRLLAEVTMEQTATMFSYLKGTFDEKNRLIVVERFINQHFHYKLEYTYSENNKIKMARLHKENNEIITLVF
ncbi:DUF6156 family protein [Serratia sp. NPDC078593]|uniref:DUF6156 family protein n=1 Tax=unclassified Serratia (in: enterobacteria) TaxID=2647522 RepID=UPI0037D420A2